MSAQGSSQHQGDSPMLDEPSIKVCLWKKNLRPGYIFFVIYIEFTNLPQSGKNDNNNNFYGTFIKGSATDCVHAKNSKIIRLEEEFRCLTQSKIVKHLGYKEYT